MSPETCGAADGREACGKPAVGHVRPRHAYEYAACEKHAREAIADGVKVDGFDAGEDC